MLVKACVKTLGRVETFFPSLGDVVPHRILPPRHCGEVVVAVPLPVQKCRVSDRLVDAFIDWPFEPPARSKHRMTPFSLGDTLAAPIMADPGLITGECEPPITLSAVERIL